MNAPGLVYLIPSSLTDASVETIPAYILSTVKDCQVFFVEDERSARRYLKKLSKDIVIDHYEWHVIGKHTKDHMQVSGIFRQHIRKGKTVGIVSEAGCPGVADPGQLLVAIAHEEGARVKPLVGPSSILLALMASGMNGQQFRFAGYLPIDAVQRNKTIKQLETESAKTNCTQIFIETPYRNNQLLEALVKTCSPSTLLCIAADITGDREFIKTQTLLKWKKNLPDINKQPAIFCLLAKG